MSYIVIDRRPPEEQTSRLQEIIDSGKCPGLHIRGSSESIVKSDRRVISNVMRPPSDAVAERTEEAYRKDLAQKRQMAEDGGHRKGKLRLTHSIPAHLYHGKMRETGDKRYWDDSKNLEQHSDWKVQ